MEKLKSREKTAQRKEKATWRTAQSTLSSPSLDPSPQTCPLAESSAVQLSVKPCSPEDAPAHPGPAHVGEARRPEIRPGARGSAATREAEGLAWLPLGLETRLVICSWD